MKNIKKDDYDGIMADAIKEEVKKAIEEGHAEVGLALMLMGVKLGSAIKEKLFGTDEELEIITEKE